MDKSLSISTTQLSGSNNSLLNLSENQQKALDYIRNNKVDTLFTEMLNNVFESGTREPVIHMIKYLASLLEEKDLQKENIKIEKSEKYLKEYSPIIREFYFPEDSTILLKRFIDPKVFEKLKNVRTTLGGHISHIIQAGLKVDNKETVGIYATDGEAYLKFAPLFKPAITMLQDYDKNYSLFELPDSKDVFALGKFSSIRDRIFSIKFKYARNIKGYPYLPYAREHTKLEIKNKLLKVILSLEENKDGKFYSFPLETSDVAYKNKFLEIENKFFDKEENFFSTLNLSKENAGVFLNTEENVAYLINFNDHLQIALQDQSFNFKESYQRIKKIHNHFSTEINFDYNSEYGYLTSCPSNLGMGLRLSAILTIPKTAEQGYFLLCCKRWSLRFKKVSPNHEIISKHKIGVPEISFVNSFILKISSLLNFEANLEIQPNFNEKKLDELNFKEEIKSLYQTYFEKYKFVVTPNLKSFNSLFKLNKNNYYSVRIPDKLSYFVFKDFIFDYITGFANINMVDITSFEKRDELKKKYTEVVSEDELKFFDDLAENTLKEKKLKRSTIIIKRNIKKRNFNEIQTEEKLKRNYEKFLILASSLKNEFGGKVITQELIGELHHTDFNLIFDEVFSESKNQAAICAYVSSDDKSLILFNAINHINFVTVSSEGKIYKNYSYLLKLHNFVESKVPFDLDQNYGYLNVKPLDSGCGFELRLSFEDIDSELFESLKKASEKNDLATHKILSTGLDVFNKVKVNTTSTGVVKKLTKFIESI